MVHVLWKCSANSSNRASSMVKLEELLEDRYADFEVLNSIEKTSYGAPLYYCKHVGGKETKIVR